MTYTVSTWMGVHPRVYRNLEGKIMQQLAKMYSPLGSLLKKYCKTSDYYVAQKRHRNW